MCPPWASSPSHTVPSHESHIQKGSALRDHLPCSGQLCVRSTSIHPLAPSLGKIYFPPIPHGQLFPLGHPRIRNPVEHAQECSGFAVSTPTPTLISPYPFLKDNCSWLQFWLGISPARATHLALATHSMVTSEVPATTLVFLGGMMMVGAMGSAGPPTSEKRSSIRRVESEIPSLPAHMVHGDFSTQSTE